MAKFNMGTDYFLIGCDQMKRLICILTVLLLLLSMVPLAWAAPYASMSGPSTVRAGDTITVSFAAGGGIHGCNGSVSYDSSLLTLNGYSSAVGSWAVEFNGNTFVCYDNTSDMSAAINGTTTIFKASFTVNKSVAVGTAIAVSATGVALSDGTTETYAGTCTYSTTIAPPLSGNNKLGSLTVSNATISPAFSPDTTKYTASVPFSTSSLQISATAADSKAKVSVGSTGLTAGGTTSIYITVTAENGSKKDYVIQVTRAQDPNYVPSSNADLKSLSVDGYNLSPVFDADVTQYYVWLPYEADAVTLKAEKADGKAKVAIGTYEELLPGKGTTVPVTVTAEDGTEKIYSVTVVRAPAHADTEAFLNGEREEEITEPVTEPITEPITEPLTEPSTEPLTEPVTEPVEVPADKDIRPVVIVVTGVICLVIGVIIGFLVFILVGKKKN